MGGIDRSIALERERQDTARMRIALHEVRAYLERELADDPSQLEAGCEIGNLVPYVYDALGMPRPTEATVRQMRGGQ